MRHIWNWPAPQVATRHDKAKLDALSETKQRGERLSIGEPIGLWRRLED
jgi:hypothetical protein